MSIRFLCMLVAVSALSFVTAWVFSGSREPAGHGAGAPDMRPVLRERQAIDEPSVWRMEARAAYGPPAPLGGRVNSVAGRLMQRACEGLSDNSWQVPAGATRRELCSCVGRMIDRTQEADGLARLTDQLLATGQLPHPNSSAMATGLFTARLTCQRGLFAALHAAG